MKQKERVENNVLKRIKNDYVFRALIVSTLSFFVTLMFAGYNTLLGIVYKSVWNIGIAVYYFLLLCIRAYVIFSERKFYKNKLTDEEKENKRKRIFLVQSILLFVIDIALIVPISLMVMQKKDVNYSTIPAIMTAAYTTYKIVISSRNIIKTRNERHLSIKILRTVNFVDALVSVLSLQYLLIMTFGGEIDNQMFIFCAVSSFAIWTFLIVLSLISLVQSIKLQKQTENCKADNKT